MPVRGSLLEGIAIIAALAAPALFAPAQADEALDGQIQIELNAADQNGAACRVSFLFKNTLDRPIADLALELVLFDTDGRVMSMLTANAGAFPIGKSRLRQFDLRDRACDTVGRILLNDVTRCEADGLTPQKCTTAARPTSRTTIPFTY